MTKTLVYCTSFAARPRDWATRYALWIEGVRCSGLAYDQMLLVDDGSPCLPQWPDVEIVSEANAPQPADVRSTSPDPDLSPHPRPGADLNVRLPRLAPLLRLRRALRSGPRLHPRHPPGVGRASHLGTDRAPLQPYRGGVADPLVTQVPFPRNGHSGRRRRSGRGDGRLRRAALCRADRQPARTSAALHPHRTPLSGRPVQRDAGGGAPRLRLCDPSHGPNICGRLLVDAGAGSLSVRLQTRRPERALSSTRRACSTLRTSRATGPFRSRTIGG